MSPIFRLPHNALPLTTEAEIRNAYGDDFCEKIGMDNLFEMPRVTAESVNLLGGDYRKGTVSVDMLLGHDAVMGVDVAMRPFIALKIQKHQNNKTVEMVEVLYKRFSVVGEGGRGCVHEDNYISALNSR